MKMSRALLLLMLGLPLMVKAEVFGEGFIGKCQFNEDTNTRHEYDCRGARAGYFWNVFGLELEFLDHDDRNVGAPIEHDLDNSYKYALLEIQDVQSYTLKAKARKQWTWLHLEGGIGGGILKDKIVTTTEQGQMTRSGTEPVFTFSGLAGVPVGPAMLNISGSYYYYEVDTGYHITEGNGHYEMSPDMWAFTIGLRGFF